MPQLPLFDAPSNADAAPACRVARPAGGREISDLVGEPLPRVQPREAGVLQMHRPDVLTKELKLQHNASTRERWLRLSSNLLDAFGFTPETRIQRTVLGPGQGLEIACDPNGSTKVHVREYTRRRNNPTETLIDIKAQQLLDAAFPGHTDRVHFTLTPGRILCVPVIERATAIRVGMRQAPSPLSAFVALSAGVDVACLQSAGFAVRRLLEWRPPEKRDTSDRGQRDLTETGVVTALLNTPVAVVHNEDLRRFDYERTRALLAHEPALGLLHVSVQCDDYSALKSKSLRAQHVADGDTTRDLTYDTLRLIEAARPAVVMVENVGGYATSPEGELLTIKLRRWGYHVHAQTFDARDFGGATSRKRWYCVASVYPDFAFPVPQPAPREPGWIWNAIVADELAHCRDVTDNVSVVKGIAQRRIRLLTPESTSAPTVFKSQSRMTKDALYLRDADGRIRFPTERLLRRLNGLPDTFTFAGVSGEVATEQIGQSIDWSLHHAIASAVREHLLARWQPGDASVDAVRMARGA